MRIAPHASLRSFQFAMSLPNSISRLPHLAGPLQNEAACLMDRVHAFLRRKREQGLGQPLALMARVTPLDNQGNRQPSREVKLREFNLRGISFEHRLPLEDRRALLSVDDPRFGKFDAEIDLSWCRYLPGGKYNSGGRFVER